MNQETFTDTARRLGELSGAEQRPFPEIRPITTEIAKLDLRLFDVEELAQILDNRSNPHDD